MLTVLILTRDEEVHIARAIASVQPVADRIVVVDSGSTDGTCRIANSMGADVLHNPWVNYATQFNWGLDQVANDTDWVLRLDADEILSPSLKREIKTRLPDLTSDVSGIFIPRYMNFLGSPVRRGGLFPVKVLRLVRPRLGRCESRWMDEHLQVSGGTVDFHGPILDDNQRPLEWWIRKHEAYANREAVDLLNLKYKFLPLDTIADARGSQAARKRWLKEKLYSRMPTGLRAVAYFVLRYIVRLGVLDTPQGRRFHLLQGLWYRRRVDTALRRVERHMRDGSVDPPTAIENVLGIDVR